MHNPPRSEAERREMWPVYAAAAQDLDDQEALRDTPDPAGMVATYLHVKHVFQRYGLEFRDKQPAQSLPWGELVARDMVREAMS